MNYSVQLDQLKSIGLNLFGVLDVKHLPMEIANPLSTAGVDLAQFQSLVLVGNGGPDFWRHLKKPVEESSHPFDRTTIEALEAALDGAGLFWLYPNPRLIPPIQKMARHMNLARPSLLGLDLNRDFGPWFAIRAVLLTKELIPATTHAPFEPPCDSCNDQPCRSACPVEAVGDEFRLSRCADYRLARGSKCEDRCLARLACPYQKGQQYDMPQTQYHMTRLRHLQKLSEFGSRPSSS
ncbi:MAG: hypothetical protein AB7F86_04705 [Bdellovibrionales bacterium]